MMAYRTILVAAVVAVLPALSYAACSKGMYEDTASVCGEGQVWDEAAHACVEIVTG